MIIGTFAKVDEDYTGSLETVTLSVKARITAAEKRNGNAPDFRVLIGRNEVGAAWRRTSNAGREYLSVKLRRRYWNLAHLKRATERRDLRSAHRARRGGDDLCSDVIAHDLALLSTAAAQRPTSCCRCSG